MLSKYLNSIYELISDNAILFTICVGIFLIVIFHNKNNMPDKDIQECLTKFNTNEIYEFPNLLTQEECNTIINLSRDKIKRSRVIGESKHNDISNVRTSSNTFLSESISPLMKTIDNKIQNIIGISQEKYEDLQVVHYKPGQFYKSHWDACDPEKDKNCIYDYQKGGLRFATFIIYLNDDMTGGETEFPLINKKIKPERGKGILFFNLNDDLTNLGNNKEASMNLNKVF